MSDLVALLYEALRSPYGLALSTSSPERLRQKLYGLRKDDPGLSALSFVIPSSGELWIVKRQPNVQD